MSDIIPYISSEPPPLQDESDTIQRDDNLGDFQSDNSEPFNFYNTEDSLSLEKEENATNNDENIFNSNLNQTKVSDHISNDEKIDSNDEHNDQNISESEIGYLKISDNNENLDNEQSNNDYVESHSSLSQNSEQNLDSSVIMSGVQLNDYVNNAVSLVNQYDDVDCKPTKDKTVLNMDDDRISQCSESGQFDEYLDEMFDDKQTSVKEILTNPENMNVVESPWNTIDATQINQDFNVNEDNDMDFADFAAFQTGTGDKEFHSNVLNEEVDDKDFHSNELNNEDNDFDDDDFDDFATFQVPNAEIKIDFNESEYIDKLYSEIMQNVTKIKYDVPDTTIDENKSIFDEKQCYEIWKELINFDYSPAFQFQWMQSIVYEKFLTSLGPEYFNLIKSQRATMPLFSTNPLEPIQVEGIKLPNTLKSASQTPEILKSQSIQKSQQPDSVSIHSSTASQLDLTIPTTIAGVSGGDSACVGGSIIQPDTLNIKNLEEEFIFSSSPQITKSDDIITVTPAISSSTTATTSTTLTSNEPITGRILRNLKIRAQQSSSPVIRPQTQTILNRLPDLSYMNSKVLMFPILSESAVTNTNTNNVSSTVSNNNEATSLHSNHLL